MNRRRKRCYVKIHNQNDNDDEKWETKAKWTKLKSNKFIHF